MKPIKKTKNSDIQLLRAVAIISVLGFHLRPEYVPQGYLGVDIFFAISGYLMTVILNEKSFHFQTCLKFYERRLKRLLPAYILIIFLTYLISSFFLISTDYEFLRIDTLWSMAFGTNLQSMFEKRTYFLLLNEYKFLLHTWSLSVEIQYYLIAPFILIPINSNNNNNRCGNPLIFLFVLSGISWIFQTFIPYPTISFGLIFSRIWQFLIGSIVFYFIKRKKANLSLTSNIETNSNKSNVKEKYIFGILRFLNFAGIILICFIPTKFCEHWFYLSFIRLIATCLGGFAIYLGAQPPGIYWRLLCRCSMIFKKFGIYLGDISYSVYLVHWPLIILAKYLMVFESISLWQLLILIFTISILQYHIFEKPLLHLSSKVVFPICILFYLALGLLFIQPQAFGYSRFEHPAVAGNQKIAKNCNNLEMNSDCNWDPEMLEIVSKPTKSAAYFCSYEGIGKATIFFTGNSFALRQLAGIKKVLNGNYKKLYFAARPACLTFESFNVQLDKYWECDEIENKTIEFLEKFKPDILIISQRLNSINEFKNNSLNSNETYYLNDSTTKEVARYLNLFSNFITKKIYIIEPHPICPFNPALTLAKEISQGINISSRYLSMDKVKSQIDPGWFIIKEAMKNCSKCESIDIRNAYIENNENKNENKNKYEIYDKNTKLSLFCDNNHFSPFGVERMLPILKKKFNSILNEFS